MEDLDFPGTIIKENTQNPDDSFDFPGTIISETNDSSFLSNVTNPKQYWSTVKRVIPGVISNSGRTLQGVAGLVSQSPYAGVIREKYLGDLLASKDASPEQLKAFEQRLVNDNADEGLKENLSRSVRMLRDGTWTPDQMKEYWLGGVEDKPLFQGGEFLQEYAKKIMPAPEGYENSVGAQLGEGIGSLLSGLGLSAINPYLGGASFVLSGSGEATDRAVKAGATDEQIAQAALLGIAPGATDLLPVELLLGRLKIPYPLRSKIAKGIASIGGQAFIEGVQEGGQEFLQNLIEQQIYNENKNLGDNVKENAGIGAGVGGIAETAKQIVTAMLPGRARGGSAQPDQQQPTEQVQPTQEIPVATQERSPVQEAQQEFPDVAEFGTLVKKAESAPVTNTQKTTPAIISPVEQQVLETMGYTAEDIADMQRPEIEQELIAAQEAGVKVDPSKVKTPRIVQPQEATIQAPEVKPAPKVQEVVQEPEVKQQGIVAGQPQKIITPDQSTEYEATPVLMELDALKHAEGDLQPRDRTRAELTTEVKERANKLDPSQLQTSRVSDTGAPVISEDGTIISGNGRVMSLREVYQNPALAGKAASYRQMLGEQAKTMKNPVLVMQLPKGLARQDLVSFAEKSNRSRIAGMSATERASRDAKSFGLGNFSLYQGGEFTSPANKAFLDQFSAKVVTSGERTQFSKEGKLTKEGVDRLNAAVLGAAYNDQETLSLLLESTDDNIRSITGALKDVSGKFTDLKSRIETEEVNPEMDITPQLLEAVRTVADLRKRNIPVKFHFDQMDAFSDTDPLVNEFIKTFYKEDLSRANSQKRISEVLSAYVEEAVKHKTGGFLPDETTATDVIKLAKQKGKEEDLFSGPDGNGQRLPESGQEAQGQRPAQVRKDTQKTRPASGKGRAGVKKASKPERIASSIPSQASRSITKTKAFKDWFGDSKVVDGNGEPLVVYHGTPDSNFDTFFPDQFFTADPNYADKFTTSSSASSSFYGVEDKAPSIFPVYLNISKPFDTRLPKIRKIYETMYHMKFGNGADLTERGLPDWVEARDLAEFLRDEIPEYGFDGLYIDEGKDMSGQRPMAYIPLSPTQIKSATGNRGTFDPNDPRIMYSSVPSKIASFTGFYSPAIQAVENIQQNKGTAQQWTAMIQKQSGVKKDELDWMGIEEWLKDQKGPVLKEDILNFMRSHEVKIEERMYEADSEEGRINSARQRYEEYVQDLSDPYTYEISHPYTEQTISNFQDKGYFKSPYLNKWFLENTSEEITNNFLDKDGDLNFDYLKQNYVSFYGVNVGVWDDLEGTYLAIEAPNGKVITRGAETGWQDYASLNELKQEFQAEAESQVRENLGDDLERFQTEEDSGEGDTKYFDHRIPGGSQYKELLLRLPVLEGQYTSPHFKDQEVVHVRFDTRKGPQNENVLFINEIQSDLHQAGRRRGYKVSDRTSELEKLQEQYRKLRKQEDEIDTSNLEFRIDQEITKNYHQSALSIDRDLFIRTAKNLIESEKNYNNVVVPGNKLRPHVEIIVKLIKNNANLINSYREALKQKEAIKQELTRLNEEMIAIRSAVPSAPFKGDLWLELALKRMIKYASDNGFDTLSWARGEQIAKVVGGNAEALGVQYNQKIGNFLKKYLKKWNVSPEPISLQNTTGVNWSIKLTDDLEKSIQSGQALFAGKEYKETTTVKSKVSSDVQSEIQDAVEIVSRMAGANVRVEFQDRILASEGLTKKSREALGVSEQDLEGQTVGGFFEKNQAIPADSLIGLAFNDPKYDLRTTAGHEAWHYVEMVLANEKEQALLRSRPEQERMAQIVSEETGMSVEQALNLPYYEVSAIAYQKWRRDREEGNFTRGLHAGVRRLFERIYIFLRNIQNAIKGLGFNSYESLFEQARTGQLADRANRPEPIANDQTGERYASWSMYGRESKIREMFSREKTDKARVVLQDKMLPLKRTMESIEEKLGVKIPVSMDVHLQETLFSGRTGERLIDLKDKTVQSLVDFLRKNEINIDSLGDYCYALHAPERNAKMKKINPDLESGSGMTNEEAARIIAGIPSDKKRAYGIAAKKVRRIIDQTRHTLYAAGLIDKETYDDWGSQYKHYFPLRGFEAEESNDMPHGGKGYNVRGPESMQALGRRSKADNPVIYAVLQAQQAIIRSEKNRVLKSLHRAVTAYPDENLWKIYTGEYKKRISPKTGLVEEYFVSSAVGRKENVVSLKIAGKTKFIEIKDESLLRALKGVGNDEALSTLMKGFMKTARLYSAMQTQINPEFVLTNAVRDIQTAVINIGDEKNLPKWTRTKIITEAITLKSVRGILSALRGKGKSAYAPYFEEYRLAGGKVSFVEWNSVSDIKNNIDSLMTRGKTMEGIHKTFEFIGDLNTSVENAVRLSVYVKLRESGVSQDRAAFVAKELTVNFNRKGEAGPVLNAMYIFYNAAIQGTARMMLGMARSRSIQAAVAGIFAAGMMMDILNTLLSGDDEDESKKYDNVPDWIKERNLIVMTGDDYVMFPMPYGYNFPYVAGQNMSAVIRGAKKPHEAALSSIVAFLNAFNPLGTAPTLSQQLAPTLVDPFIQASENTTWYGGKIQPQKFDHKKPDSENYFSNAPWWAVDVAKIMNKSTGGNSAKSGYVDVSPEIIQHYYDFATGGIGRFISQTATTAGRAVSGDEWIAEETPFVRRFYGKLSPAAKRNDFFEAWNKIDRAQYEVSKLITDGDIEEARQAKKDNAVELEMYPVFKSAHKQMKVFRKQIDQINLDRTLSDSQKRLKIKEIEEEENKVLIKALSFYKHSNKQSQNQR